MKSKIKNMIDRIIEDYKILRIRWICQRNGMDYDGRFYFPCGFAPLPDCIMTHTEREEQRQEKIKDWTPYRRTHGYEEGSYMDKIMKKYGGIDNILVTHEYYPPRILADFQDFRYRRKTN